MRHSWIEQFFYRFYVKRIFHRMNPGFQLGDVVAVVSERPLGDDLPAVERRIDIVDRHTEDLDAVFMRWNIRFI